jgi:hypothetical protein
MSNSSEEPSAGRGPDGEAGSTGIGDEQLPEDLRVGEDNPLAEPLSEDERRDDLDVGAPDPTEKLGDGPQEPPHEGE